MPQPDQTPAHDAIPEAALRWHRAGQGAALATVVQTWGSAPRPVGSQLAISGTGEFLGSVSGGCVEGAVVLAGQQAIQTGACTILEFGVSDDDAFAVGLACGGTIRVMVEPVGPGAGIAADLLAGLCVARAGRRAVACVTDTGRWHRRLIAVDAADPALLARFRSDTSGFLDAGPSFAAIHNPPLRLAVVGAVHIAQPLVRMARLLGYDVTLIDPRDSFAAASRFPDETIVDDWPDAALTALGLDARTAVVTLTHDPKLDDPAILTALGAEVFYLGCLGSTRTHAKRLARLGLEAALAARINGPVGLDIGGKSPAEIAVSILAEMTQALRRG